MIVGNIARTIAKFDRQPVDDIGMITLENNSLYINIFIAKGFFFLIR